MIAGIYVRVSTGQQREEGTSLASQEMRCRQQAEKDGYSVPERLVWREAASGDDLYRDVLDEVRRAAQERQFDALYVYHLDRLTRDPVDLTTLLREFNNVGVQVVFVVDDLGDGPEASLIGFIRAYAAQQERLRFRERSMRGRESIARNQQRVPHGDGQGILGYRYDPATKRRVKIPEEAKIVRRIYHEVTEGRSMYSVCCGLMDDGILTKQGNRKWHVTTVRQILSHTCYFGLDIHGQNRIISRNKSKKDEPKVGLKKREPKKRIYPKPESEWIQITGYTEPIITREEWEAAQAQLKMRQPVRTDGTRMNFLTGITTCGTCGQPVRSATVKLYRCKATRKGKLHNSTCSESHIPKQALEDLVWEIFCDMVLQPDLLLSEVRASLEAVDRDLPDEIAKIRRAIKSTEEKYNELLDIKGDLPPRIYENRLQRLNDQNRRQEAELETMERLQQQQMDFASQEALLLERCGAISDIVHSADGDEKGKALRLFGATVVATRDRVEIDLAVNLDDGMTVLSPSTG